MSSAWDQLQQLLTCPICLDKYRAPKLLPCHHSFCQEPCMDGLQDYARRQIKCPVCRAEHRIPLQGIQSYPTNVTLMQFLELHQSISGEEPEPVPSMMERCGICSERSLVQRCYHCDKKICTECKEAHLDILKREISRICSQVRRALNRLQESLTQTGKNSERLNINYGQIKNEIEEIVRRFIKDLKAKEEKLIHELEQYTQGEIKNLEKLKEDLEIEHQNMGDNCDLIEKIVSDAEKNWTDVELIEYKDIFLKSLEFLRSFDPDSSDYTRRMKFVPSTDLNELRRNVANFGELKLPQPETDLNFQRINSPLSGSSSLLAPPQNVLMRSQSDHRLASQFARRESRFGDLTSSSTRLNSGGYSDSERDPRSERASSPVGYGRAKRESEVRLGRYVIDRNEDRNRYFQDSNNYRSNWSRSGQDDDSYRGSQFKSRFMREREADLSLEDHDYDSGPGTHRSVRFEEPQGNAQPIKVFDTQDAPRGPLSGIVKLSDSPHFMERMHENEARAKAEKEKKEEETVQSTPAPQPTYQPPRRPPSRQVSEDEIEKQKKMNKMAASSSANNTNTKPAAVPAAPNSIPQTVTAKSVATTPVSESATARYLQRKTSVIKDEDKRSESGSRKSSDASSQAIRRDTETNPLEDNEEANDLNETSSSRVARRRRTLALSNEDNKEGTSSGQSQLASTRQVLSGGEGENLLPNQVTRVSSIKERDNSHFGSLTRSWSGNCFTWSGGDSTPHYLLSLGSKSRHLSRIMNTTSSECNNHYEGSSLYTTSNARRNEESVEKSDSSVFNPRAFLNAYEGYSRYTNAIERLEKRAKSRLTEARSIRTRPISPTRYKPFLLSSYNPRSTYTKFKDSSKLMNCIFSIISLLITFVADKLISFSFFSSFPSL